MEYHNSDSQDSGQEGNGGSEAKILEIPIATESDNAPTVTDIEMCQMEQTNALNQPYQVFEYDFLQSWNVISSTKRAYCCTVSDSLNSCYSNVKIENSIGKENNFFKFTKWS